MTTTLSDTTQTAGETPRSGYGGGSAAVHEAPIIVWKTLWAHGRTRALEAAVTTGLFDRIAEGRHTAEEIAEGAQASRRGTRMLLDTLAAMGLLVKAANRYHLTPTSAAFLVSTSPTSMCELVTVLSEVNTPWTTLADVVRSGEAHRTLADEAAASEFFPKLIGALFPSSFAASNLARNILTAEGAPPRRRVLDVGAGSAAWSLAWAVVDPETRVTALDFEGVIPITKHFVGRMGARDRYDYIGGNLRDVDFGRERYDLIILGQICHTEGPIHTAELVEKSARALAPGGLLLIGDIVPNDERTGPVESLLFGLQMLLNAEEGDVFTLAQYCEWTAAAGLVGTRKLDFGAKGPDVVVATKPAGSVASVDVVHVRRR